PTAQLGVEVGTGREFLPPRDLLRALVRDVAVGGQRVGPEEQERRGVRGFDGGDDRRTGLARVAGLGAVHGVVLFATLPGCRRVVVDDRGRLRERAPREIG